MWVSLYLELWERTILREKDGIIHPGTIEGWNEWYGDWVKRHLTYEMWKDLQWNRTEGTVRKRVEEVLVN